MEQKIDELLVISSKDRLVYWIKKWNNVCTNYLLFFKSKNRYMQKLLFPCGPMLALQYASHVNLLNFYEDSSVDKIYIFENIEKKKNPEVLFVFYFTTVREYVQMF